MIEDAHFSPNQYNRQRIKASDNVWQSFKIAKQYVYLDLQRLSTSQCFNKESKRYVTERVIKFYNRLQCKIFVCVLYTSNHMTFLMYLHETTNCTWLQFG